MAFKRALWHSGLTYQQKCRNCKNVFRYKDDLLDFRPWYADGFVYCPKCKTPLRHSETLAIDAPQQEYETVIKQSPQSQNSTNVSAFCSQCGKKFDDTDLFCSGCGTKRK